MKYCIEAIHNGCRKRDKIYSEEERETRVLEQVDDRSMKLRKVLVLYSITNKCKPFLT